VHEYADLLIVEGDGKCRKTDF